MNDPAVGWLRQQITGDLEHERRDEGFHHPDPRFVAICEAMLAVLDEHAQWRLAPRDSSQAEAEAAAFVTEHYPVPARCKTCHADRMAQPGEYPCPSLHRLAFAYRSRAGYAQHWGQASDKTPTPAALATKALLEQIDNPTFRRTLRTRAINAGWAGARDAGLWNTRQADAVADAALTGVWALLRSWAAECEDDGAEPFTCPRCQMRSWNANDLREGYCGNCHDWTAAKATL